MGQQVGQQVGQAGYPSGMATPKRFGSIKQHAPDRFQASYADPERPGKRRYKRFTNLREAEDWLTRQRIHIEDGTWAPPVVEKPTAPAREPAAPTVADWATQWLQRLEAAGRSPNTLRTYGSHLRRYIIPPLGGVRVSELTREDVRRWWDALDPAKPLVRVNAYRTLSTLMNAAVEDELITASPVKIKGALTKPRRSEEWREARERVATPSQVDQIAAGMPARLRVAVYLAAWCGLRYGEIAGLTRRDIDLTERVVRVRRAVKRDPRGALVIGPPKSERSRRDVPIPARIVPALTAHLAEHVDAGAEALIVTNTLGRHLSDRDLLRAYRPAVDAVDGLAGLTFHQLRATCASQLMATGATPVEIMAILGHSDWTTSMLYQRAPRERLRAAMDRLSEDAT